MHTQRRPRAGREVPNAMGWGHVSDLLQVLPTSEPRTVRLVGELDASNAEEFLDTLLPQLEGGGDLKLLLDSPQRAVARTIELVGLEQAPNIAVVGGPPADS